jgi:hypothetical protein
MSNPFSAIWNTSGQHLCLGRWLITYMGLPLILPSPRDEHDLGTYNIYSFVDPDDELYAEGLMEDEWIVEHIDWLAEMFSVHNIPLDEAYFRWFYRAVNAEDWRCGSCGGC